MTRSPRVDSACRFFPEIAAIAQGAPALALAIGLGLALLQRRPGAKSRQGIARAYQGRHLGGRRRIDQGQHRDVERLADHRPRLCRDAFQQAQPDQHRQRQEARAGVELSDLESVARRRGHAARGRRHHVRHRVVERGARHRRPHRQAALDLRSRRSTSEKGYKGCCDVVNRGVALWKGKVYRRRL